MVRLPDPLQLCSEPPTEQSLKEADVLLTLVVGAAVQCPQREHFIGSIKTMPVAVQQAVAERIQRVTSAPAPGPSPAPGGEDGHSYVWPSELVRNSSINILYKNYYVFFFQDDPSALDSSHVREELYPALVRHVKRVARERDRLAQTLVQVSKHRTGPHHTIKKEGEPKSPTAMYSVHAQQI